MIFLILLGFGALFLVQNVSQPKPPAAPEFDNVYDEDNWYCETIRGVPCPEGMMETRPSHWKVPTLRAYRNVTCTDTQKKITNTWLRTSMTSYNDRNVVEIECLNPSTPCITDFNICIQDYKVPAISLHCRYLKNFEITENEDAKCGANGAKQETYTIDSGYNITKFDFNCKKIRFEKAVPETEPGNDSDERNWLCETIKGGVCPTESFEIRTNNVIELRAHANVTWMNREKTEYFYYGSTSISRNIVELKSSNPSTPCLTNFQICIQNFNDPAIRLRCRFIKDFDQTEKGGSKCGANGAKQETYTIDSVDNVTEFEFNCEKVHAESHPKKQ